MYSPFKTPLFHQLLLNNKQLMNAIMNFNFTFSLIISYNEWPNRLVLLLLLFYELSGFRQQTNSVTQTKIQMELFHKLNL